MNVKTEDVIRDATQRVARKFGKGYRRAKLRDGTPAIELWDALAEAGLVGIGLPETYGGGGQGIEGLSIVAEELAKAGHFPVLLVMSPGIAGSILLGSGTQDQKNRFLPGIISGKDKFAFAITEAEAGSNTYKTSTSLTVADGETFYLNGSKCFISGVDEADYIMVVAKMKVDGEKEDLRCCIIRTEAEGLTKSKIETETFSADSQWLLHFDNIPVRHSEIVGEGRRGLKAIFEGLNPERILMASFCTGIGQRALHQAVNYACDRTVWDSPIATHQAISHPLAESKIELELARTMNVQAAMAFDTGEASGEFANYAKYAAARAAVKAVDRAIQTHGGNGFTKDFEVSELYWPARLFRTAPVSEEMILNYVSNQILGLPRSY